jgi:hypothetical protein
MIGSEEQILEFVGRCRDEHVAPYPVGIRVISECTGLPLHSVRIGVEDLLYEGLLTKMPAFPDYGVVLPSTSTEKGE